MAMQRTPLRKKPPVNQAKPLPFSPLPKGENSGGDYMPKLMDSKVNKRVRSREQIVSDYKSIGKRSTGRIDEAIKKAKVSGRSIKPLLKRRRQASGILYRMRRLRDTKIAERKTKGKVMPDRPMSSSSVLKKKKKLFNY